MDLVKEFKRIESEFYKLQKRVFESSTPRKPSANDIKLLIALGDLYIATTNASSGDSVIPSYKVEKMINSILRIYSETRESDVSIGALSQMRTILISFLEALKARFKIILKDDNSAELKDIDKLLEKLKNSDEINDIAEIFFGAKYDSKRGHLYESVQRFLVNNYIINKKASNKLLIEETNKLLKALKNDVYHTFICDHLVTIEDLKIELIRLCSKELSEEEACEKIGNQINHLYPCWILVSENNTIKQKDSEILSRKGTPIKANLRRSADPRLAHKYYDASGIELLKFKP